jgi:hypothetical protein
MLDETLAERVPEDMRGDMPEHMMERAAAARSEADEQEPGGRGEPWERVALIAGLVGWLVLALATWNLINQ